MNIKNTAVKIAAGTSVAMMSLPSMALAADTGSFESTVTDVAGKGNDIVLIIAYALLTLVAAVALFNIAKEVLPALFARERPEFSRRITACIVIVIVCIFAAFAPMLIDSITNMLGSNVDLGTATRS